MESSNGLENRKFRSGWIGVILLALAGQLYACGRVPRKAPDAKALVQGASQSIESLKTVAEVEAYVDSLHDRTALVKTSRSGQYELAEHRYLAEESLAKTYHQQTTAKSRPKGYENTDRHFDHVKILRVAKPIKGWERKAQILHKTFINEKSDQSTLAENELIETGHRRSMGYGIPPLSLRFDSVNRDWTAGLVAERFKGYAFTYGLKNEETNAESISYAPFENDFNTSYLKEHAAQLETKGGVPYDEAKLDDGHETASYDDERIQFRYRDGFKTGVVRTYRITRAGGSEIRLLSVEDVSGKSNDSSEFSTEQSEFSISESIYTWSPTGYDDDELAPLPVLPKKKAPVVKPKTKSKKR